MLNLVRQFSYLCNDFVRSIVRGIQGGLGKRTISLRKAGFGHGSVGPFRFDNGRLSEHDQITRLEGTNSLKASIPIKHYLCVGSISGTNIRMSVALNFEEGVDVGS